MKTEIKHSWFYNQTAEEIWAYLTQSELIEKWLMPNNFEPTVGRKFEFTTNPIPSMNLNGSFYCEVMEVIPLKKLVYSWNGGASINDLSLNTIVEWTIETKENGIELHLVHTGFTTENAMILGAMTEGWDKNIQTMKSHLKST